LARLDILRRVKSAAKRYVGACVRLSTGWLGRDNQPVVGEASATQNCGMSAERLHPTAQ